MRDQSQLTRYAHPSEEADFLASDPGILYL